MSSRRICGRRRARCWWKLLRWRVLGLPIRRRRAYGRWTALAADERTQLEITLVAQQLAVTYRALLVIVTLV